MKVEQLNAELLKAVKEKNIIALGVWRLVKAKAQNLAISKGRKDINDDDVKKALQNEYNEMLESLKRQPNTQVKIDVVLPFRPNYLSQEETETYVQSLLDQGLNIGQIMKQCPSEYDRGLVSKSVIKLRQ